MLLLTRVARMQHHLTTGDPQLHPEPFFTVWPLRNYVLDNV